MPWDPRWRKPQVTGVSARAIEVIVEAGDSGPVTPIGINLPNDQDIRETLRQQVRVAVQRRRGLRDDRRPASSAASSPGAPRKSARAERWGAFASELTTNLHEIIGHGSGLVSEALKGAPEKALKEHFVGHRGGPRRSGGALLRRRSVPGRDRDRATPSRTPRSSLAEYEAYARNALVQLRRIREGAQIEEDHMRNRQLIVHWLLANTEAITIARREGKTYYRMVDAAGVSRRRRPAARPRCSGFKAEGDYAAAHELLETYGVHFDPDLRDEVVARVDHLDLPSYTGFVMPTAAAGRRRRRAPSSTCRSPIRRT